LENPFATCLSNKFPTEGITIDSAEGCSKSAIGECGMLIFGQLPYLLGTPLE
jgi:hypothetical protein